MIAQLGMYDMPALRAANAAFWTEIRTHLGFGPEALDDAEDFNAVWTNPDLLFSQTCGYPYRAHLQSHVQLVGTPDYNLPGCPAGFYNSVLIARADDPRVALQDFDGACFAYNEPMSQSGWAGPMTHLSAQDLAPGALLRTGGHMFSAVCVASGKADFAGLDALTWTLLQEHDPSLTRQLRELARTEPTPTLPYITGPKQDVQRLAEAVEQAIVALEPAHRKALHLNGLVQIPNDAYLSIPTPQSPDAFEAMV